MTGGAYVHVDGLVAWRSAEWFAARERRAQLAALATTHAYTPRPASLLSASPWQIAMCGCGWDGVEPLPAEKAAAAWRMHIASIDSPRTWHS